MPSETCCACGSSALQPHLQVAGEAGEQGLHPTTDAFGTALADIVRCERCGHMQLERMPDRARLEDEYARAASEDYVAEETGQRETARRILEVVERHAAPGRLLDVGSWVGFFMDEARARGWEPIGIEPSAFAATYARQRLGLNVVEETFEDADLPGSTFGCVFAGDVIEHLPEPGGALERMRELLEPGGVVAMALPDAGSRLARRMGARWWSVIPTHVQYFTRRSIGELMRRGGFEVVDVRTAPKVFSVAYYLGRAGGYSPALGRALVGTARAVGLADRLWAPDFRDRMLVVARVVSGQ